MHHLRVRVARSNINICSPCPLTYLHILHFYALRFRSFGNSLSVQILKHSSLIFMDVPWTSLNTSRLGDHNIWRCTFRLTNIIAQMSMQFEYTTECVSSYILFFSLTRERTLKNDLTVSCWYSRPFRRSTTPQMCCACICIGATGILDFCTEREPNSWTSRIRRTTVQPIMLSCYEQYLTCSEWSGSFWTQIICLVGIIL